MLYTVGNKSIPSGVLTVNRSHPISRGLIACWVPGRNLVNISGSAVAGLNLGYGSASTGYSETLEGPGVSHTATGSGLQTAALPSNSPFLFGSTFTFYYRCNALSAPSVQADYFAIIYNNTNTSPFYIFGVRQSGLGFDQIWNSNGTLNSTSIGSVSIPTSGIYSLAQSATVNGNIVFYFNGVNKGTAAFGAFPPTNTATSFVNLGENIPNAGRFSNVVTLVCYCWNRVLSDAEILALDLAPYSLLRPVATRQILKTPSSVTTVFRKTLSPIGGRVGSRQIQGWAA